MTGARQYAASAVVALAACFLPVSVSAASNLEIRVGDCRSNVEVEARNVRLSDVLARLAKTLDFKMRMEGADPLINVSMSAPASEVVAALAAEHWQLHDPACKRCPLSGDETGVDAVARAEGDPVGIATGGRRKGRHVASAGRGGAGDRDGRRRSDCAASRKMPRVARKRTRSTSG